MSVEAIAWALKQPIKQSSAKFVLVVMANCADGKDFHSWPSIPYIVDATGQNRKTVVDNMRRLREWGFIEDTGERKGGTGSVIVYRLASPKNGTVSLGEQGPKTVPLNRPENGTASPLTADPFSAPLDDGEAGPKTDRSRPENGQKQARKRTEAGPKTGLGTVIEPSGNRQGTVNSRETEKYSPLTDLQSRGVDRQIADDWLTLRKGKKAPVTKTALDLVEREAEKACVPLTEALRVCCMRGWSGFKAEWLLRQSGAIPRQSEGDRRIAEFLGETRPLPDDGMTLEMETTR